MNLNKTCGFKMSKAEKEDIFNNIFFDLVFQYGKGRLGLDYNWEKILESWMNGNNKVMICEARDSKN